MATFYVRPAGDRPDYRVVISFLWSDEQNVDTDGDSYNPASRTWTYLFIRNREPEDETIEIGSIEDDPLVLEIESELECLAARVAWFLATETGGDVAESRSGPFAGPDVLKSKFGE